MKKNIIKIKKKQWAFLIMIGFAILINFGTAFSFKRTINNKTSYQMSVTIKYVGVGKSDSTFTLYPIGSVAPQTTNPLPSTHEEDSIGYLVHSIVATFTLPDGSTKTASWIERKASGKDIGLGILSATGLLAIYQQGKAVVATAKELPGAVKTGAQTGGAQGAAIGASVGGSIGAAVGGAFGGSAGATAVGSAAGSAGTTVGKTYGTVNGATVSVLKTVVEASPVALAFEAMDDTMGDCTWTVGGPTGDPGDVASYGVTMTKQK